MSANFLTKTVVFFQWIFLSKVFIFSILLSFMTLNILNLIANLSK